MKERTKKRSPSMNARKIVFLVSIAVLVSLSSAMRADTGNCEGQMIILPFTDVSAGNVFFCSIAEAFFSGLTNGTSDTTYSPGNVVPREQMAAFVTRTMDQTLKRGSRRSALNQYWTTQGSNNLALTTIGDGPQLLQFDKADVWVANGASGTVSRVRASDGKLVGTWTGASSAFAVLCAMGKVFVTGDETPGKLYQIDPTQTAGAVSTLSSSLGNLPIGIAYDGQKIWTANGGGSVSIITLKPPSVTNVSTGFTSLIGILYDGANIWVPNESSNTISVVRAIGALGATVLVTLNGNGLNDPSQAAFDGERILVTNQSGNSVSLWRASDLAPIGVFTTGTSTLPLGVCSDRVNFWITLSAADKLARF